MPPIILTLLQALFLLLLYVFVARAVRVILRDVRTAAPPARAGRPARSPLAARGSAPVVPRPDRRRRGRSGATPAPGELVVHLAGGRPRVLRLDGDDITFGRTSSATVVLDDPYVSDRHARISHDGRQWVVSDLGSTNGTFLNQVKVTAPTPIAPGDQLGVGRTVVEVRR